jgi:hypothetical protein
MSDVGKPRRVVGAGVGVGAALAAGADAAGAGLVAGAGETGASVAVGASLATGLVAGSPLVAGAAAGGGVRNVTHSYEALPDRDVKNSSATTATAIPAPPMMNTR